MVYLLFNDAFPGDTGYPAVLGEVEKLRTLLIDKYNNLKKNKIKYNIDKKLQLNPYEIL